MKIAPFIIALTGATASGKSYVIEKIIEISNDARNIGIPFTPVAFPKYTTREYRPNEIAKKQREEFIDVISVDEIPDKCDLVYRTYGKEYGLKTRDLKKKLDRGECPIVVINDVRAVEELKKVFIGKVLSLFLFRHVPNFEEFKDESNKRGNVSENELFDRYNKATALYRIYIENITVFDRVILNVKDECEDENKCTELQIKNILNGIFSNKISLNNNHLKGEKLFILSGNNASGKDDVNRAVQRMGKLQAEIISKYTSRHQEEDDADEMICRSIPNVDLIKEYKAEYEQECSRTKKYYDNNLPPSFIDDCKSMFIDSKETFENFCNVQWDIQRLKSLRDLQKPFEKFWSKQNDNKAFFQDNDSYIDLDQLQRASYPYNPKRNNETCYIAKHNNSEYMIYENHGRQVKYAFSLDGLSQKMEKDQKHRVLVASLVNLFEYCQEKVGKDKVIPIFSYSQISKKDYDEQAESDIEKIKSISYDDLKRYSDNIVDFKHVIIYAETQMQNESGGQKEELIDQMFRLFRAYNYDYK